MGVTNDNTAELKNARNAYYYVIWKAKRISWQNFLKGEASNNKVLQAEDKNRCWSALKYTKPLKFKTTPALNDGNGNTATSMKAKEALVRKTAFPPPPTSQVKDTEILPGTAYLKITQTRFIMDLCPNRQLKPQDLTSLTLG